MKKILCSLLVFILVVGVATGCSCSKKDEKTNTKNSTVLDDNANVDIKDTKVDGLNITDFVVVFEDGMSEISFTIENNNEASVNHNEIECNIYDKNKELLYSFTEPVGVLEAMDETMIEHRVNLDLTKAAEVEYVFK